MKLLKLIYDKLEEHVMIALLCGMAVVMMIQIFCRYVLGTSLSWSEEITRYMFIWSAFMSVSLCTKLTISIRIDAIIRFFSKRGRALVKMFNLTVELAFFVYIIPYAWRYLLTTIASGQVSPACGIPMYYVQSAPLICFCLCCVRILERFFLQLANYRHNTEYHNWKELKAAQRKEDVSCLP
ncbi:MAG: TRAP transporter small permease [Bacteroidaceae bacterium]|nr:TRAP transporter small permease [Bacteroidaceae bacterium]